MLVDIRTVPNANPYNLGARKNWTNEEVELLLRAGAILNEVQYLHIPQENLVGTVPLGLTEKRAGELRIAGTNLRITGKGQNKRLGH